MKKFTMIFMTICLIGTMLLNADETKNTEEIKQSYGYFSFGGGFPAIFTFSAGHRSQSEHHGFDAGFGVSPVLVAIEGHGYFNYLFFPRPDLDSQIYMGLGSQIGYGSFIDEWANGIGFIKPHLIFGKEYTICKNQKRFIQAELGGVYFSTKGTEAVPSLMVTYGLRF